MVILSVSDVVKEALYSEVTKELFSDVDLVVGCGDLPYYYLEFITDVLNVPLLFVRGNHDPRVEISEHGERTGPMGAVDLHRRVVLHEGVLFAGLEGSIRYREGGVMYSQRQMWRMVVLMIPRLLWNKVVHGRYLDILVTHSPPAGIHDQEDQPHRGFKSIRWLIKTFQPDLHLHGHVRVYQRRRTETQLGKTRIINTYTYQKTTYENEHLDQGVRRR
jgi:uncharacterized protein